MKRSILLLILAAFLVGLLAAPAMGESFPAYQPKYKNQAPPPVAKNQPPLFYGYVPPPPIRHTWPGGYRVIFHEMLNTFVEHMLGRY
jgi:hypothetical protein